TIADVTEYRFARDGKTLVYARSTKEPGGNGVFAVSPGQDSPPVALRAAPGKFSRLTWDEKQTQLVFFHDQGEPGKPNLRIGHWKRTAAGRREAGRGRRPPARRGRAPRAHPPGRPGRARAGRPRPRAGRQAGPQGRLGHQGERRAELLNRRRPRLLRRRRAPAAACEV